MIDKLFNIHEEYLKDSDLKKEDVLSLVKWCNDQPTLPNITEHEGILFLASCNYDQKLAQETVQIYFLLRTTYTELFGIIDPSSDEIQNSFKSTTILAVPELTPDGYRVHVVKFLSEAKNFSIGNLIASFDMMVMIYNYLYGPSKGTILILDSTNLSWSHLKKITLGIKTVMHYINYLQDAVPVKIKGIYMINNVAITDKVIKVIKPLMKKELSEMLIPLSKLDDLYEYVPKKHLVTEYGGSRGNLKELEGETINLIMNNRDFFLKEMEKRVDESLLKSKKSWYKVW